MKLMLLCDCCMKLILLLLQVLAARLMQAIVPSLEHTKDLDVTEQLVNELFKALGSTLMFCRNDPMLLYSGLSSACLTVWADNDDDDDDDDENCVFDCE